jgi:CTP synthase (UTP-ammonia lyase)
MADALRVALIGDYNATVLAHQAIPRALQLAASAADTRVDGCWLATDRIEAAPSELLPAFDAFWCVPASPYRSTDGALHAIRFARENGRPFLGTCGGFQHAVLEFARNVLGVAQAAHAELDADASAPFIAPLTCSLIEVTGRICLAPGSKLYGCYRAAEIEEAYHCCYGVSEERRADLEAGGMQFTAFAEDRTVRGFEVDGHPFFVGTLFQPERAALREVVSPPIVAFLRAALRTRSQSKRNPDPA